MDIYFQSSPQPMVIYFTGGFNFNSYDVGGGGVVLDGNYGAITVTGEGSNWTVNTGVINTSNIIARAVTFDKLPEIGGVKLLGRHNGTVGDIQEINIDGGLEFHGSNLRRSAIIGDINIAAGGATSTLSTGVVSTSILGGDITPAGKALLDDINAAAQRNTLGLGTAALVDSSAFEASGSIVNHAIQTTGIHGISSFAATILDDLSAAAVRDTLNLGTASMAATGDFAQFLHTHPVSGLTQSGASTGQLIQWNGSQWAPASLSLTLTDRQAWTTAGTFNWTNPSPLIRRLGKFRLIGGGGGGGSGRKGGAGTVRCGGGGGAGGAVHEQFFWTDEIAANVTVTVGAGGAGGASVTANATNGNTGVAGGNSIWGIYIAIGGNPGAGGTNAAGAGGAGTTNASNIFFTTTNNVSGTGASTSGGVADPVNILAPVSTGGAPGGGITTANAANRGGNAQLNGSGTHGTNATILGGNPGLDGITPPVDTLWGTSGRGGSGGGASITGNAGRGGNGVAPGGGGAGGGAATDSVGNSGAGGNGGDGMVEIIVF